MESPTKRRRIERSWESDEDDDLSLGPNETPIQHDPDYQLQVQRAYADNRFQSTMAHIFEKYGRDFEGVGDEIDMMTGEIVVNNGHLKNMRDEGDIGMGFAQEGEDGGDEDEEGGLRLEDLLDDDEFESSEDEETEDEAEGDDEEDNGEADETSEGEEQQIPRQTEPGAALPTAPVTHQAETSLPLPAARKLQSFAPGPFGGMNPFGGPSMGFGASPLAFGHSPLAFNPWGQHLPQQSLWDGPEIPQHQVMANRKAFQPRQNRRSQPSAGLGTSIWTSGTRYESQLRARRSFQRSITPRTGAKTKPRPRKQPQLLDQDGGDGEATMAGRRRQTMKKKSRRHPQEVQDSDDEGSLPSPPQRKPLRDSKNQGNDKSPDQRTSSRNGTGRSRKRKLSPDNHDDYSGMPVELALRSKSPSSSRPRPEEDGQHNSNEEDRGRYGRQRKPVEHFSQISWPTSRQGKWRSERKAAARAAAGQGTTEEESSSSEDQASDPRSAGRKQRAVGREKVVPDSQESLTPPNSSLPRIEKPAKSGRGLTEDFDPATVLSDDERPMQILSARSAPTTSTSATQLSRKKAERHKKHAAPKRSGQARQSLSSEHPGYGTWEIPPPPSEGNWVLINTTKRPPYYRRLKEKTSAQDQKNTKQGESRSTGHGTWDIPPPPSEGKWVLINTTKRPPYYRRLKEKATTQDPEETTQGESQSTSHPGFATWDIPPPPSEGKWVLINTTKRPPYYRRLKEKATTQDPEDTTQGESQSTGHPGFATWDIPPPPSEGKWVLINTTKRPPYYRRLKEKASTQDQKDTKQGSAESPKAQGSRRNDSDEWVLIKTTKRPAYYRRRKRGTSKPEAASTDKNRRKTRLSQGDDANDLSCTEEVVDKLPMRRREVEWLLKNNGKETSEPEPAEGSGSENDADEEDASRMEGEAVTAQRPHAGAMAFGGDASELPVVDGSQLVDAEPDVDHIEQHRAPEEVPVVSKEPSLPTVEAVDAAPDNTDDVVVPEGDKLPSPVPPVPQDASAAVTEDQTAPDMDEPVSTVEEIEATPANEARSNVPRGETVTSPNRDQAKSAELGALEPVPRVEGVGSTTKQPSPSTEEALQPVESSTSAARSPTPAAQASAPPAPHNPSTQPTHETTTSSPFIDETDQENDQPSSAPPRRLGSPELGSPSLRSSKEDPYDLPPSPAAPRRPKLSPSKTATTTSPSKPSPLRKSLATSKQTPLSPTKPLSPSKITKPPTPRTPRHRSPQKQPTPSSRRSLLSLARAEDDDDLDELSFAEVPKPTTIIRKRRSSVAARRIWKATPRTTEVYRSSPAGSRKEVMQGDVTRTPGGTLRTCGVDGFTCERDFCFVCL